MFGNYQKCRIGNLVESNVYYKEQKMARFARNGGAVIRYNGIEYMVIRYMFFS